MRSIVRQGWLLGVLAGALSLVAPAPPAALAQTSTGTIRGHVLDENTEPLTGAAVTAMNSATNFRRGMLTEEGGFYNLGGLPVGEYVVEFSHPSYAVRTQNVRVQIGQVLNLDVVLFPDAIEVAGITAVIERERMIEPTTPEVATNITQAQIENLPQLNRNFLDFAALAPGVIRTRGRQSVSAGGLPAENINLFIDGATYKNDVLENGVVGQDASDGNPFPQNAVQEFRVITQNYKAEFQKAAGAVITATTKSGTNEWQGDAFFFGQSEGLIGKDVFQRCEAPTQDENCVETDVQDIGRQQFGGSLGGPLVRDKLFVFGSYEGNYRDLPVRINDVPQDQLDRLPDRYRSQIAAVEGREFTRPLRSNLFFGKMTHQPGERHRLEGSVFIRDEFETRDFGGGRAKSRAEDFNNDVWTLNGRWQYSNNLLLNEAGVEVQRFQWNPTPLNTDDPGLTFFGILDIGGRSTAQDFVQDRFGFRDDLTYTLPDWNGSHVLKTGAYVDFLNYDVTKFLNGNPEFRFRQDDDFEFPFEADMGIGDPNIEDDNTQIGLYGQDDWAMTDRLILNLGVRWDVETNMLNNDWVTPDSVAEEVSVFLTPEQQEEYFTDGNDRDPFLGAIQPRLGFSYDLTGGTKTVLFGGFGIFYDRTFFNRGLDERFRLQFPVFRFRFSETGEEDPAGNPTIPWEERFLSREGLLGIVESGDPRAKPEVFLLENDTKPPRANQWTIGVRQAIGQAILSVNYTGVRSYNQNTWLFGNRREDGGCCQSTETFGALLLSSDEGRTWYDALLVQLGLPFSRELGWGAQVSYTLAESEQDFGNQAGDNFFTFDVLTENDFERFPSSTDIRHRLVGNWIVALPWDFLLSGIATFSSDPPLTAQIFGDPNNDGIQPDFPDDEGKNARRFEEADFAEVNLRIEKQFGFLNGQRIGLIAEIFNLFDNENFGCQSDVFAIFNRDTGQLEPRADFGQANCVVGENPSRRVQLGFKYGF